ncbi:MAG TPA: hypothetical protein VEA36_01890 [Candidatus Paceibacterota bacterium]|nr:hypothetical protein [Candidatus Paceibacterota bacterium]
MDSAVLAEPRQLRLSFPDMESRHTRLVYVEGPVLAVDHQKKWFSSKVMLTIGLSEADRLEINAARSSVGLDLIPEDTTSIRIELEPGKKLKLGRAGALRATLGFNTWEKEHYLGFDRAGVVSVSPA